MKFKIDRKELVAKLTIFIGKGRLNTNAKLQETVRSCYIYALESKVMFIGKDDDASSIYAQFEMDAEILESGEKFYPDLLVFFNTIKDMRGKELTVEFTKSKLIISDGIEEMTFGVAKILGFKDLVDWAQMNSYDGDNVSFSYKGKGYVYDKWFTIEESSNLRNIPNRVLDKTFSSLVVFDTTDVLEISAENSSISRSFKVPIEVEVHKKARIETSNIFPVLKYLRGPATFYYHIQGNGKLVIYVVNKEYEWMIRHKEVQSK